MELSQIKNGERKMIGKFIAKTTLRLTLTGIGLAIGVPLLGLAVHNNYKYCKKYDCE